MLYSFTHKKRIQVAFYIIFNLTPNCFPDERYTVYRAPPDYILSAGILEQSMGARNRVGIGLSYRTGSHKSWNFRAIYGGLGTE